MTKSIHIGVDARPLSRNTGGIRRYLECLLTQMTKNVGTHFSLYSDGPINTEKFLNHKNITVRMTSNYKNLSKLSWQWQISQWLKQDTPDIFWAPRHHVPWKITQNIPVIVTIHDVIWKTHPETIEPLRLLNERLSMPHAINRANEIIAISQTTANQIINIWPSSKYKVTVIKLGATEFPLSLDHSDSLEQNYFLAVGTIEPRKNYLRLIQAFDHWANQNSGIDLVLAGHYGWQTKAFNQQLKLTKNCHRIHVVNNADDEQLARLYKNAKAFIQISLSEGFGMPITEAKQFGLPLVLSDIPIFREINPSGAVWTDPLSIDSITDSLDRVSNAIHREQEQLLASWNSISGQMLDLFQSHYEKTLSK